MISGLGIVDQVCLACIAFASGSEVHLAELWKMLRPVISLTLSITAASWSLVCLAFLSVANWLPFMSKMGFSERFCVASLAGTISVARSPATAIAVLREVEDRTTPFCSLSLAVIVLKDVLVIILFAFNLEFLNFIAAEESPNPTHGVASQVLHMFAALMWPLCEIFGSAAAGLVGGFLTITWLRHTAFSTLAPHRAHRAASVASAVCTMAIVGGSFLGAHHIGLEPLLVCVVMGICTANQGSSWSVLHVAANLQRGEHIALEERDKQLLMDREVLEIAIDHVMPTVNLAFFSLAGAALAVDTLAATAHISVIIFMMRLVGIIVGTRLGAQATAWPPEQTRVAWMAYVTQAGVAIGLTKSVVAKGVDWGAPFSAIMTAVIVCNSMVGPLLFKLSITLVEETSSQGTAV
ncbi:hypothetical protein CYMTET_11790 [Cymbomonas tetramitiformis]|uniref:Cation/H+ exchanger transmembrane domain-containing protein n=1 Tax=Cymbomonas tetramitiformis TaxID=36881 RepID=A0AAE0GLV1_9CHLO|nr:hypothetical protein CYMTET_11790 [Cymbomonas tetramitiformis]